MKRIIGITIVLVLGIMLIAWSNGTAQVAKTNWDAFSKNLVKAIASDNEGLQLSAMGMIIRYSDSLDVDDAVFDIVRIFRNHKNPRVRRLALVTLHKIQNDWSMYFLQRNRKFETDPAILKQSCCIVNYYLAKKSAKESEGTLLADKK